MGSQTMLTVLTQGPPFLSRNWASARDASSAFGPGNRLIARHPLLFHGSLISQRIDENPSSANKSGRDALRHHALESPARGVALAKAFVPCAAEPRRGPIGHCRLYIRLAAARARMHPVRSPFALELLGASQGRCECRFRPLLGAFYRGRRRLAIELCANRLRCHGPGVRVSRGLAHCLFELRDPAAARTRMSRRDAEAKGGGNEKGCGRSADRRRRISKHLHDLIRTPPRFPVR